MKPKFRSHERGPGGAAKPPSSDIAIFGFHAVAAAWLNPRRVCRRLLLTTAGKKTLDEILPQARKLNVRRPDFEMVEHSTLDKLVPSGAVHQGIVLTVEALPEPDLEDVLGDENEKACLIVLDQVTDPHNVGAILRSASAFGAKALLVTERHAPATTGTLAKAASGALEHVPIVRVSNLAQSLGILQKANYWCIGLDESGPNNLHQIKMPQKVALVLGAEGEGLRRLTRERCDEIARLPTKPPIGSLNVSNAAAVALYEVMRKE